MGPDYVGTNFGSVTSPSHIFKASTNSVPQFLRLEMGIVRITPT
jgi:hypothetical protein